MKYALLLMFLTVFNAQAKDDWFCNTESSQTIGDEVQACGRAKDPDEDKARGMAFESAKAEFLRVCKVSDNCRNHDMTVEPKRTTCDKVGKNYECVRMVSFHIGGVSDGTKENSVAALTKRIKVGDSKEDVIAALGMPKSTSSGFLSRSSLMLFYEGEPCVYTYCSVSLEKGKVWIIRDVKPQYNGDI